MVSGQKWLHTKFNVFPKAETESTPRSPIPTLKDQVPLLIHLAIAEQTGNKVR